LQAFEAALSLVEEDRVHRALRDAFQTAMRKVDLSESAAAVLHALTQDQRHQAVLDQVIEQVVDVLDRPATRLFLAGRIIAWLKEEHPGKAKLLPTGWIGENGARVAADWAGEVLDQVKLDQGHELRRHFDAAVQRLIARLQADPALRQQGEQIKGYLLADDALATYVAGLWGSMRTWIVDDMHRADSVLHARIAGSGQWLGERLANDEGLRATLNQHLDQAAHRMAPEFAVFLTGHIRDTIRRWDAAEMSDQIELNVGRDLQAIRINGTVVGGAIGLLLYLVAQLPALWQAIAG